jgi:hypothetical protein
MLYSAYFAERAEHYHKFAERAPNGWQAENKWALANLFLEMSWDMRLRELAADPTVQRDQNGTRTLAISTSLFPLSALANIRRSLHQCWRMTRVIELQRNDITLCELKTGIQLPKSVR